MISKYWLELNKRQKADLIYSYRVRGWRVSEVAEKWNISERTVKNHSVKEVKKSYKKQKYAVTSQFKEAEVSKKFDKYQRASSSRRIGRAASKTRYYRRKVKDKSGVRTYFRFSFYKIDESKVEREQGVISLEGYHSINKCLNHHKISLGDKMKDSRGLGQLDWIGGWSYMVYQKGTHKKPLIRYHYNQ